MLQLALHGSGVANSTPLATRCPPDLTLLCAVCCAVYAVLCVLCAVLQLAQRGGGVLLTTQVYRELMQAAAMLSAFVQAHRHAQERFHAHMKVRDRTMDLAL